MRIIFMGTPDFSVPALRSLAAKHEIVCVYTQPPRPAGRGKNERPSPVHQSARAMNLAVRHPSNFKSEADRVEFAALQADVAVVVAYGLILPQALLDAPKLGCLNVHASLLPRWRGAAPIHRAIMAGDSETGVCIMQMDAGLDTGPVLLRAQTRIETTDTTGTLHDRLSVMGGDLIVQALANVESLCALAQPETGISYAAKIDKAEAQVDWAASAQEVACKIRGLSPFPGAWTKIGSERIKLLNAQCVEGSGAPGTTLDNGLTVACGSGAVRLLALQRAGKGAMTAEQLLNGFPVSSGTVLGA